MSDNPQEKNTIRYQVRRMRFRAMRTRLRLPVTWLLHRRLDPRDVFIASFPRSGSHWLKFQLLEIITGQSADFENVKKRITRVGDHGVPGAAALVALGVINPGKAEPLMPDGSRLMHTHEPYRRDYRKVIYLVRDVRDVALSEFAIGKELGLLRYYEIYEFDNFLEPFLNGSIDRYRTWPDHVISYLDSPLAKNGNLLVLRFEDLRKNPEEHLRRILEFLGVRAGQEDIRRAIAHNTVEKMRAKEDTSQAMRKSSGEEGRFVRRGSVGGWRESFTEKQVRLVDQYAGRVLELMGYPKGAPMAYTANAGGVGRAETRFGPSISSDVR
jgi:hypothetical protein